MQKSESYDIGNLQLISRHEAMREVTTVASSLRSQSRNVIPWYRLILMFRVFVVVLFFFFCTGWCFMPTLADIYVPLLPAGEMLELHRGQGKDLYWRDSGVCPTEEEYHHMVEQSTSKNCFFFFIQVVSEKWRYKLKSSLVTSLSTLWGCKWKTRWWFFFCQYIFYKDGQIANKS